MSKYEVGDFVVYSKRKVSERPGPRAANVQPSRFGDDYRYEVDKYWTVASVIDDQTIEVMTRTGKTHPIAVDDPHLRKASTMERIRLRNRFPDIAGG